MTPEQLAALVADNRNAAAAIGKHPGVIAKIIIKRHTDNADAIEHLQAEVARLSTPPDDAEVRRLVDRVSARARARQNLSKRHMTISDADIDVAVSHHLTRLSHALAAETAKREALEAALRNVMSHVDTPIGRRRLHVGSPQPEWLTEVRAALATHGSK